MNCNQNIGKFSSATRAIGGCGNTLNRKTFSLEYLPVKAELTIVCDPHTFAWDYWMKSGKETHQTWLLGGSFIKYRIFINDTLAGAGPFRAIKQGNCVCHTFDVTGFLTAGVNVLGIFSRGEKRGFACELSLTFADGKVEKIVSDTTWRQFNVNDIYSPVCWAHQAISQDFKGGAGPGEWAEHIDGSRFPDHWSSAEFDASNWQQCSDNGFFDRTIEPAALANYMPARVEPATIEKLPNGHYIVDFGREVFAGIEMTGVEAGEVEIRLSETLLEDKRVQFQMQTFNCYQDVWTFRSAGQKLAHFGLRMFRYAELIGLTGELQKDNICAVTMNTPFAENESSFACSEPDLEKIWQLCKNSIKYTNIDCYVDCLSRERIPYEADSYINMLTAFAMERNYDLARRTIRYQIEHPTWPCEWAQFVIPLVYEYVMHSGDMSLAFELYDRIAADFSFHNLRDQSGLVKEFPLQIIVDWPESQRDGYDFGNYNAVPNAFVYYDLILLAALAQFMGKDGDYKEWMSLAGECYTAFNRELFDAEKHLYKDNRASGHSALHSSMFAAAFGLVPEQEKAFIGDFLEKKGMACSVYGAQFMLEALFNLRRGNAAVDLMLSDGEHSWLEMLRQNATATFEAWRREDKGNMSKAHPWGSAPGNQIVRSMFGLRPLTPGWEDFTFDPQPGKVQQAAIVVPTLRGFLHASIRQTDGGIEKFAEFRSSR